MMNKKRQRKFIIAERRKEARKIQNELHEYWRKPWEYAVPEKPIRKGWKRSFQLKYPHILSGQNAAALELLPLLNNTVYSPDKKFLEKSYRPDGRSWVWSPIAQNLNALSQRQYEALRPDLQQFFRKLSPWEMSNYTRWTRWWRVLMSPEYVFKKEYLFTYKIEKHYVEKVRVFDPVEESKHQENRERFYGTSDWHDKHKKLLNLRGDRSDWCGKYQKTIASEKSVKKEIQQEIQEVKKGGIDDE